MFQKSIKPPNINEHDKVILFDSVCKLCNRWGRFIIRHDKQHQIKLCAIQSNAGIYLLEHHPMLIDQPRIMLYLKNGHYYNKSEAFFELMSDLGNRWRLVRIFRLLPLAFRDWLYDIVACNRYRVFGKYDRYRLPQADHQDRYLW